MSAENRYLNPPPTTETTAAPPSLIEVINAISALLAEQRRFDRQTVEKFKRLFGDGSLKWWIIFAGVGGVVEAIRLLIDIGSFLWVHLH